MINEFSRRPVLIRGGGVCVNFYSLRDDAASSRSNDDDDDGGHFKT